MTISPDCCLPFTHVLLPPFGGPTTRVMIVVPFCQRSGWRLAARWLLQVAHDARRLVGSHQAPPAWTGVMWSTCVASWVQFFPWIWQWCWSRSRICFLILRQGPPYCFLAMVQVSRAWVRPTLVGRAPRRVFRSICAKCAGNVPRRVSVWSVFGFVCFIVVCAGNVPWLFRWFRFGDMCRKCSGAFCVVLRWFVRGLLCRVGSDIWLGGRSIGFRGLVFGLCVGVVVWWVWG